MRHFFRCRKTLLSRAMPVAMLLALVGGGLSASETLAAPTTQAVEIERQGFESTTFPPPGWEAIDVLADQSSSPANLTWGRETCDPAPGGGAAVAWSHRAGTTGSGLGCLEQYTGPVFSILRYGPIDTRPYPQGLEVNLLFKLDAPGALAFQICVEGETDSLGCFGTGLASTDWAIFPEPGLSFSAAGGLEAVYVEIQYADLLGISAHYGALVDEVVIRGVGGSGTPPPGLTPSVTPSPAPSQTPSVTPSQTPSQTPSVTPSPTVMATASPGPSATASASPLPSATPLATRPPTLTPRPTASPTSSPSPTAVASATSAASATMPPEPTPTRTATLPPASATPTSSRTPVATATAETPSPAPSASPEPSATPSPGPSPTADGPVPATPSPQPSQTVSPEVTPTMPPPSETPPISPTAVSSPGVPESPTIFLPFAVKLQ